MLQRCCRLVCEGFKHGTLCRDYAQNLRNAALPRQLPLLLSLKNYALPRSSARPLQSLRHRAWRLRLQQAVAAVALVVSVTLLNF